MEPSAEQINEFYNYFTPIYDENGKQINPLPTNEKVTVWCESNNRDEEGFIYNVTSDEMGIEVLIAKSFILQHELDNLIMKTQQTQTEPQYKVIDKTYHEEEGQGCYKGTYDECLKFVESQGPITSMFEIVPV